MRLQRGPAFLLWIIVLRSWGGPLAAQQTPPLSLVQRQWLGCWELEMQDSVPPLHTRLLVRLDSIPVRPRERDSLYQGRGLAGFAGPAGEGLIGWLPKAQRDSVEIIALGEGGLHWRLARSGDSLMGQTYEYYESVPAGRPRGPVVARRQHCPS